MTQQEWNLHIAAITMLKFKEKGWQKGLKIIKDSLKKTRWTREDAINRLIEIAKIEVADHINDSHKRIWDISNLKIEIPKKKRITK